MKRIAILGAGGMGTALAVLLAEGGRAVTLWARDPTRAAEIAQSRENARHLPGVTLPATVAVHVNACDAAAGADLLVAAIPSAYLRATLAALVERMPPGIPALSVVKGIENQTFATPSRIILETLGPRPVAALSGPSHAEEMVRGLPASVVVAGLDEAVNVRIQQTFNRPTFRVYTNTDLVGVELAGALKNVLGIAAGICDGLGFGDNAKAALLTRGLVEMTRFAVGLGARAETFYGLAGVGDLVTTCYSPFGRNRALGERIGGGLSPAEALAGMVAVAEGVPTTRSVRDLAARLAIEMPIIEELARVLFDGKSPREAVTDLLVRSPKDEGPP